MAGSSLRSDNGVPGIAEKKMSEDDSKARYVEGEVIVRFKPEAVMAVKGLMSQVVDGQKPLHSPLQPLNDLIHRFEIRRVEPLFPDVNLEELAKRFPERAKRAPKGVGDFSQDTFKISFDPSHAVSDVVAAFQASGLVFYAEPNHIMKAMTGASP